MEKFDASCLIDAKKEYTQRFVRKLKIPFLNKIMKLFSETKDESVNIHEEDKLLIHFQNKLESVPEYSLEKINTLTNSIILESKCDYLEELFQGVYIVHTKVLAVIQHHKSNIKSELKIPTIEEFIFQAFINICRSIWKYAYLFRESNNTCEYQKNTNSIENRIEQSIKETLEDVLPVRELLIEHVKDYIDGDNLDDVADDEENTLIQKTKLLKRKKNRLISGGDYGGSSSIEDNDNDNDIDIEKPPSVTPILPSPITSGESVAPVGSSVVPAMPNLAPTVLPVVPSLPPVTPISETPIVEESSFNTPSTPSTPNTPSTSSTPSTPSPVPPFVTGGTTELDIENSPPKKLFSPDNAIFGGEYDSSVKEIDLGQVSASKIGAEKDVSTKQLSFAEPPPKGDLNF